MFRLVSLVFLLCSAFVAAWLPADQNLFGQSGIGFSSASGNSKSNRYPDKLRKPRNMPTEKVRGVNLGSLFVIEPWMANTEWQNMGCAAYQAESECVQGIGQDNANQAWLSHWQNWIVKDDIQRIASYGLNTIRIPVGWWMDESLVANGEYFPQGGFPFLERVCEWAAESNLYVIMDLHALPGAQKANASFTGLHVDVPAFYQDSQYNRAATFLSWITTKIHNETAFRTVGMLEVANEPAPNQTSLVMEYYPQALSAIREAESAIGVPSDRALTIQYMDEQWGAGNPMLDVKIAGPPVQNNIAFDNHYYLSKSSVNPQQDAYISWTCSKQYNDDSQPLVTGEWSLAVNNSLPLGFNLSQGYDTDSFSKMYWAAQVQSFEKNLGWVFWSWKTNLEGYTWDYQQAVAAGIISTNPADALAINVCDSV